jgi:hypothetical protein
MAGVSSSHRTQPIIASDRVGHAVRERDSATAASQAGDEGTRQPRRRSGWSAGTSTMQMRTPSGSAIHISSSPHGSRLGSRRIGTPRSPSSRRAAASSRTCSHNAMPGAGGAAARPDSSRNPNQKEERTPVRPAAELAVDGQPRRVPVEHPAALGVGRVQQHAAAQHVHGPMIAPADPAGAQCLLQAAGRREPETLCGEAFPSQAMAVLHDSDTRLTTSLPRQPAPNVKMTSVCAGHRLGGAPRRNRTGDPILTMEPPGTAVRNAVSPGHARPSGSKLSALLRRSYGFSCLSPATSMGPSRRQ